MQRVSITAKMCYLIGSTFFAIAASLFLAQPVLSQDFSTQSQTPVEVIVPDTIIYVSGQTAPNSFVTIKRDGATIGTARAGIDGRFTKKLTAQPFGLKTIQVFSQDPQGRLTDTVGEIINIEPQADTYIDFFLPPAFTLSATSLQEGSGLIVGGSAFPNSVVTLNIDNNFFLTTQSDANGNWQTTVDTNNFYIGSHVISGQITDQVGSKSLNSLGKKFSIFGQPEEGKNPNVPTIEDPFDGQRFATRKTVVKGSAQANTQVELFANGLLVGSIFSNSLGQWQIPYTIYDSEVTLRARECASGACSDFSDSVTIYFSGGANNDGPRLELNDYSWLVKEDVKFRINARINDGFPPYELYIDWGDGNFSRQTNLQQGLAVIDYTYLEVGRYNAVITITDSQGNTVTQFFTVRVEPNTGGVIGNIWWLLLGALLMVYAIEHYIRGLYLQRRKEKKANQPSHIPY